MDSPTLPGISSSTRRIQLSASSWLEHTPTWLPRPDTAMRALIEELAWTQEALSLYGKTVLQPRLTATCGRSMDPASRYLRPRPDQPWTPVAAAIRDVITEVSPGWTPNGLIANHYRTGADSISPHSDNESALGRHPVVASVSLGATRTLHFRHVTGGPATACIHLAHGDLLIMGGACQAEFHHYINKTKKPTAARLSLTYRRYHPAK
jgi:alkylated DNA repair dioxygenase AlkB